MNPLTTQYVLLAIVMITIGVIALVHVGALWLRLALIDILAVMVIKRIEAIGEYLGSPLVSDSVSNLATLLALGAILFAFGAAYARRPYLMRAERERQVDLKQRHGRTIRYLEVLREQDEQKHRQAWDTITRRGMR